MPKVCYFFGRDIPGESGERYRVAKFTETPVGDEKLLYYGIGLECKDCTHQEVEHLHGFCQQCLAKAYRKGLLPSEAQHAFRAKNR